MKKETSKKSTKKEVVKKAETKIAEKVNTKKETKKNTKPVVKKETKVETIKKETIKKDTAKKIKPNKETKTILKKETKKNTKPDLKIEIKADTEPVSQNEIKAISKNIVEDNAIYETKISEIKPIEKIEVKKEPKPTTEKKKTNYKPLIIAACIVIAIVIIFSLINGNKKTNKTIKLSEINEEYVDTEYTITLPDNWMISNDGELFEVVNDRLASRGALMATTSSLEEYDELINAYGQYYELETVNINGNDVTKLHEEVQEKTFTYYLSFADGIVNQVVFIDTDETLQTEILSSIK